MHRYEENEDQHDSPTKRVIGPFFAPRFSPVNQLLSPRSDPVNNLRREPGSDGEALAVAAVTLALGGGIETEFAE